MSGRQSNPTTNNCLIPCFFLSDCILLAGVVVLWYFMQWWDQTFTLHLATIVCSDLGHYSFPDTGAELIPEIIVYVLAFVVPPIVILFGEAAVALYYLQGGEKELTREKTVRTFGIKLHALLRRTVRFTGIFLLGAFLTWILTRAGKIILGRPAPYFFSAASCLTPCASGSVFTITDCADTEDDDLARQSFPSLYASLSAYSSVFVAVYITALMRLNSAHAIRPFVGLAVFSVPFLLGVEQVASYKSHWTDVIAGWILGGAIAAYLIFAILDTFRGPLLPMTEEMVVAPVEEYDTQDDFVIGNGTAMRNGMDKPLQMNGLRQSNRGELGRDREPIRDTYLDRAMEVNEGGGVFNRSEPATNRGEAINRGPIPWPNPQMPSSISGQRVADSKRGASGNVDHYMY
ncbi:phospholipid phosphatase-related protein type 1-like [Diadema antillarum]|uniref:phospholipid phosphatase-related protein type 1-like n=1 Tax=Diadema antillarum TaxID=105358 RepID=UPI003A83506E